MRDRTILVTGGAGFIGSHFIEYIANHDTDCRIIVLDALTYAGQLENTPDEIRNSSRFEFWQGDVRNDALVNDLVQKSDVVVHFAAESHVSRSIYNDRVFFESNVLGTQTVANAVVRHIDRIDRFIHISTSEVYGTGTEIPMREEHPMNPSSPYGSSKAGGDRLVYSYWVTYGIPAVIVRPFNNYGPRQHLEKAIPRFITRAIKDEPITIHGDGIATRDWLYVKDHCEALYKLLDADLSGEFGQSINIGTGRETSVIDIAKSIVGILGKPESLITYVPERPGQVNRHMASYEKINKLINWTPSTSIEEGLRHTVDWYITHQDWWKALEWLAVVPVRTSDGTIELH